MRTIAFLFLFVFFAAGVANAQTSDEVRAATGLPTPISGRASLTPQIGVDVTGSIIIDGEGEKDPDPEIVVYVVSQTNLAYVFGRQRVRNKGSFRIEGVPTGMMTLVLEIGGKEFARYSMNAAGVGAIRQDVSLTWAQVNEKLEKLGVIDAKSSYTRTKKNQDLFDKAMEQKRSGKSDQAASTLMRVIKEDPKDFIALNELGNILFDKDPVKAEEAYRNAYSERPDLAFALVNLGKLQFTLKNYDASIETLNKALAIDAKSADAYQFLGENHLALKKGSLAVGFLNKAIEIEPIEKADLHLRLAALYNAANLKDRAANEYRAFLAKVPNYEKRGDLEKYIEINGQKK